MRRSLRSGSLCLAAVVLAACAADVPTGAPPGIVYNGTYTGSGTVQRDPRGWQLATPQSTTVTLTLSQLGPDFSGTMSNALTSGVYTFSGDVAGTTTLSGGTFDYVQAVCPGTLHGSFTNDNGRLSGSATGRDCDAGATGDNARITFTGLVRQP